MINTHLTIYSRKNRLFSSESYILDAAKRYCRTYGTNPPDSVDKNGRGKPYFGLNNQLFPSLSHSGDYIVAAISGVAVGVDVQIHKKCDSEAIARRFFYPEERLFLLNNPSSFFQVWALKESCAKLTGEGIPSGFRSFPVADDDGIKRRAGDVFLYLPDFVSGYSLAAAAGAETEIVVNYDL